MDAVQVLASTFAFVGLNRLVEWLAPSSVRQLPSQVTKWKKIGVSFVHSFISGALSLYAFYDMPAMAADLKDTYSNLALSVMKFSTGYFIYDTGHLLMYPIDRECLELVAHHSVILVCFCIALYMHQFVAYGTFGLLIEVNTIFLHFRHLMLICGVTKKNLIYKVNSYINVGTFCLFRLGTLIWMIMWAFGQREEVGEALFFCGIITLLTILIMSIVLLYRVIRSDFFRVKQEHLKS